MHAARSAEARAAQQQRRRRRLVSERTKEMLGYSVDTVTQCNMYSQLKLYTSVLPLQYDHAHPTMPCVLVIHGFEFYKSSPCARVRLDSEVVVESAVRSFHVNGTSEILFTGSR